MSVTQMTPAYARFLADEESKGTAAALGNAPVLVVKGPVLGPGGPERVHPALLVHRGAVSTSSRPCVGCG